MHVTSLHPTAVTASSAAGSALDLSDYEGPVTIVLDAAAMGASVTLAAKITESDTSGGSYTDVVGGGFTTTAANTASRQSLVLNSDSLKKFIKIDKTIAGGTGTGSLSVSVIGFKKYS